ncbi:MAG: tetratricopeptide repeat protein [Caldilineaceae bacterium]
MTNSSSSFQAFGSWVRRLRTQQDLTQEALAELAYCSVQTIRFFETGKRRASLEMAERLAEVLGVPAAQHEEFLRLARQPLEKQEGASEKEEAVPTPAIQPAHQTTLPQAATTLVGREGERNILIRLLQHDNHRLVTLVGAGGMGKTRLALETATALAPHFAEGAAFVSLTPIQSAAQLPEAVADVLTISRKGDRDLGEQVVAWLAPRQLLLVLDNFEQLLEDGISAPVRSGGFDADSAVTWIKSLLQRAPKLQILITSRERLRISGERIFELGGLSLPSHTVAPEAAEAVKLFIERAQHVTGDFALDEQNKAAVVRICQLADGMPLGIELAAAWVRALTCEEIAEEMARSLDFLVRADRDIAPRHHNMRAVFDSSWRLLVPAEQQVVARLAVLRGSFDRAAAQAVASTTLPQLAALVDKSFVRVGGAEAAGFGVGQRYDIHELLRQYLLDKLHASGEEAAVKRRHAEFFTALVERLDPDLHADHSGHWRRQLAMEQSNLRMALAWSVGEGHDVRLGLRLAAALGSFWETSCGWKEGRQWLQSALALTHDTTPVRGRALVKLGELHHLLEESTLAEQRLREGLTLWQALGERASIAYTFFQLGKVVSTRGDYEQAKTLLTESLVLYRQLGHRWGIASLLHQLGSIEIHLGNYEHANQLLDEAWPLVQTMDQRPTIGVAANLLGRALLGRGDVERAITLFQRALQIFQQEDAQAGVAWSFINLALTYLQIDHVTTAKQYFQDCFRVYRKLESKGGMMATLEGLAAIAALQGDATKAVQLLAVAAQWRKESGQALTEHELSTQQHTLQLTKAALAPAAWQSIWHSVKHWSVPQVAKVALA